MPWLQDPSHVRTQTIGNDLADDTRATDGVDKWMLAGTDTLELDDVVMLAWIARAASVIEVSWSCPTTNLT